MIKTIDYKEWRIYYAEWDTYLEKDASELCDVLAELMPVGVNGKVLYGLWNIGYFDLEAAVNDNHEYIEGRFRCEMEDEIGRAEELRSDDRASELRSGD